MSLIDSLSKPRWQHSNPEVRKTAIGELDDQSVLAELVNADPDPQIRSLALARVTDPDLLDELTETLQDDLQAQARKQRLQQLLPDIEQLDSVVGDEILVRIAGLADETELSSAALERLESPEVRMQVATGHAQARIRLLAAQKIDDIERLQALMQQSRNKDKAVYRHCKDRLDSHHEAERAEAGIKERVGNLVEKAIGLDKVLDAVEFKGLYLSIKQQWPALREHASADQEALVTAALELGAQRQRLASEARVARQEEAALAESSQQEFNTLLAELDALDDTARDYTDPEEIASINTTLNRIEEQWVAALRHADASAEQNARCKSLLNEWRVMLLTEQRLQDQSNRLEKVESKAKKADHADYLTLQRQLEQTESLISSFVWPESHISIMPEPIQRLHAQRDAITGKLEELKKNEKQNLELLEAAFEKLREELKTNHFDKADREYRRLRNVLRRLSPDRQHRYQRDLRPLVTRLKEIHDWQGFAIEPKKLDLIARMKGLGDGENDVDVLARKIKALQKEWKHLGHLAPHRDQELWLEFKAAADEAYAPCKAAFEERAVLYQQNVDRRMELISQLVEYEKKMHWPEDDSRREGEEDGYQAPDWKLVQKTLDTARQAFRNIKPVDRKGERKTQKKLKSVCDRIYGHIKLEYERNIALKEQLVERANTLIDMEDLESAISQAKSIQRDWKDVGMTPMRVDRKLWKKFRTACDAVFARLGEQKDQARQAMSEQINQAEELLKQARSLIDSADEEQSPHLKKEIGALRSAMQGIELPVKIRQQMNKRFGDLEREALDHAHALRRRKELQSWQELIQNMKACALKSTDESAAAGLWREDAEFPKGIDADLVTSFWNAGPGDSDPDRLREACIALEVLFELDSPPEDKKARMDYQMKRLVEGLGGLQSVDRDQQLLDHINRFIELRPAAEWADRFCTTVERVKKLQQT